MRWTEACRGRGLLSSDGLTASETLVVDPEKMATTTTSCTF